MEKVAVVTGASSGIGLSIAHQLAKDGFNLVLNFFGREVRTESLTQELSESGVEVIVLNADIASKEGRKTVIAHTSDHFGKVDVLINNAGIYNRTKFTDLSYEAYEKTMAVNVTGALFLTQGFVPVMQENSSIIFMSSVNAFIGSDHGVDYNISKLGLIAAMQSLAQELAPRIRVNAIAPGSIDTPLIADDTKQRRSERIDEQLIKRLGTPEDVAHMVSFLVSDKASFITGQTFHINGGRYFG